MRSIHYQCGSVALLAILWVAAAATAEGAPAASPIPALSAGTASKAHDFRDKNFDYFVVGDPARPRARHTEFALALMGGGGRVDAAYASIARHAGDGHIVILRAVSDDGFDPEDGNYGQLYATAWGPVVSAETFVFHRREASFDPRVTAALRAADGIFLAGGDQGNYVRYWKDTPVQQALNAHVLANRPIGGSSAGLAILGHYSYTSLDGISMESKVALADPYNKSVTIESDFLHLRWLERVVTDTHFSARGRLGRLIVFLARIGKEQPAANPFGIGIDENSALLIGADGVGRMAAGSAGSAWIVRPQQPARVLAAGQPLSMADIRITRLTGSGTIDLTTGDVADAAAETLDTIERGALTRASIASPILLRTVVPTHED